MLIFYFHSETNTTKVLSRFLWLILLFRGRFMMSVKGTINSLIGRRKEVTFEARIFHTICIILMMAGVLGFSFNLLFRLPFVIVMMTVAIVFVSFVLLYISRFKKKEFLAAILFLVFAYVLVIVFWLFNAGIDGVIQLLFFSLVIWQLTFFERKKVVLLLFNIFLFISLLIIDYKWHDLVIGQYRNDFERYFDHGFTYILSAVTSFFIIKTLLKNYKKEHAIVKKKNLELENINQQLKKSITDLEKANSTKNKLFSVVSHDIRSFAGNISNFSFLLVDKDYCLGEEKEMLFKNQIFNSANNLNELLGNLLAWAKIQMDDLKVEFDQFDIAVLIQYNYSLFKMAFEHKHISVNLSLNDSLNVYADKEKVSSIIRNLLSNAMKYTPKGGAINISAIGEENFVAIAVVDNGIGMTEDELLKISNADTYYSQRGTENESGTGLGLIIIKEFVEANNGTFQVKSEKGKGSEFTVRLPLK